VRAHIEEDTGKTSHMGGGGRIHDADRALVDYNRAGVPLVEIVSAPDIRSAAQARRYVEELRAILMALEASDGRMEEGSLRVDANVSVREARTDGLGTRCEIKNVNSLRSLARAIEYETERQVGLLEAGEPVLQQTRHWDEQAQKTVALRSKEEAFDYRYFPEPDLVPVAPDPRWQREVATSLPPMPAERRAKLTALLGAGETTAAQADQVATVVALGLDKLVVEAASSGVDAPLALARTANEAAADAGRALEVDPAAYGALLLMEQEGKLTPTQAKAVLADLFESGGQPQDIARRKGFEALGAENVAATVADVVSAHPEEWQRYCGGEDKLVGFFTGLVMQATDKKASGKEVAAELRRLRG
jgi:aspartyl-tRNA(Asn)/glutamyl-tRNA(Gln) amidotransferase subunit B